MHHERFLSSLFMVGDQDFLDERMLNKKLVKNKNVKEKKCSYDQLMLKLNGVVMKYIETNSYQLNN